MFFFIVIQIWKFEDVSFFHIIIMWIFHYSNFIWCSLHCELFLVMFQILCYPSCEIPGHLESWNWFCNPLEPQFSVLSFSKTMPLLQIMIKDQRPWQPVISPDGLQSSSDGQFMENKVWGVWFSVVQMEGQWQWQVQVWYVSVSLVQGRTLTWYC